MPRVYKRTKEVREGKKSSRAAARDEQIGYDGVAETHKVLSDDMESELAKHIKNLADQSHGLSSLKCRELANALIHNIPHPHSIYLTLTYQHNHPLSQDTSTHLPQKRILHSLSPQSDTDCKTNGSTYPTLP
uniref:Uncharacterized protein n=1 Tax=Hucho hucho TaxID=62062 RepID=A0A4W5L0S3_9TELE